MNEKFSIRRRRRRRGYCNIMMMCRWLNDFMIKKREREKERLAEQPTN